MCLRWRQISKPIVCGVKGYTIYHGTALLSIADVALAADDLRYMPSLIEYNSLPWETGLSVKRSKEILFLQVQSEHLLAPSFSFFVFPSSFLLLSSGPRSLPFLAPFSLS
jgi:hypothetical protein